MKDLTAVVPWAKSVIKGILVILMISSCTSSRISSKHGLSQEEYNVINAYFEYYESNLIPVYFKTSNDREWSDYIDIDYMVDEKYLGVNASRAKLEQLLPPKVINILKDKVKDLASTKLQGTKLKNLIVYSTLKKAEYRKISKPVITGNIAVIRIVLGKKNENVAISVLEKIDHKWVRRHDYLEKLTLY